MNRIARIAINLAIAGSLAACGGAGSGPTQNTAPGAATGTSSTGGAGGGGAVSGGGGGTAKAIGYDCAALITPAELDAASSLKGTTIETTGRGDQPTLGQVAGVTECLIDNSTAGTWFGHFDVYTGQSLDNFSSLWDLAKEQGATSIDGVGTEAVYKNDESGTDIYAKGANGLGFSIGLAWDTGDTNESAVKATLSTILNTVISRT
jgi:hypothetical protein